MCDKSWQGGDSDSFGVTAAWLLLESIGAHISHLSSAKEVRDIRCLRVGYVITYRACIYYHEEVVVHFIGRESRLSIVIRHLYATLYIDRVLTNQVQVAV